MLERVNPSEDVRIWKWKCICITITGNLSFLNIKATLKGTPTKLIYQVLQVRQDRLRRDISLLNDLNGLFKRRLKPDGQATIDVIARFAG